MYLLYVDESGDTGTAMGSSRFFVLSGLVIHELAWNDFIRQILDFRRTLNSKYGLKLREEIHCKDFFIKPGKLARIPKWKRLMILGDVLKFLNNSPNISIINLVCSKPNPPPANFDIFERAWTAILQRFHNTISHRNFPGPKNGEDFGLIICDKTDEPKLRKLARKLRVYNPVPSSVSGAPRQIPLNFIAEDAVHRDSKHSLVIQLVDVCAYFLFQRETGGNRFIKKKGAVRYFQRLSKVLCTQASRNDPEGVVRL